MHSESQLRRRARETSRWYDQYGPYALADQAKYLVAYGLDLARNADQDWPEGHQTTHRWTSCSTSA